MATDIAKSTTSHFTTQQRTQFKEGQKVEFDGKLAKVVQFGFLELPTNPGEDVKRSDKLVANLQLPALVPGGKPEYAFYVDPSDIKSLADDPKRQRTLEMESNALFGDPVPVDPEKDTRPAPQIRKEGTVTKAEAPRTAAAIDMNRATGTNKIDDKEGTPRTVVTNKGGTDKAAKSSRSSKSAKSSKSGKSAKAAK